MLFWAFLVVCYHAHVLAQHKIDDLNERANAIIHVALDENSEAIGIIAAYSDTMKPPIEANRLITLLYVDENHRRKGIGKALLNCIVTDAKSADVMQVTAFEKTGANYGFWNHLGFDTFFWWQSKETGNRVITAMLHIDMD